MLLSNRTYLYDACKADVTTCKALQMDSTFLTYHSDVVLSRSQSGNRNLPYVTSPRIEWGFAMAALIKTEIQNKITTTANNAMSQSELEARTCNRPSQAREN